VDEDPTTTANRGLERRARSEREAVTRHLRPASGGDADNQRCCVPVGRHHAKAHLLRFLGGPSDRADEQNPERGPRRGDQRKRESQCSKTSGGSACVRGIRRVIKTSMRKGKDVCGEAERTFRGVDPRVPQLTREIRASPHPLCEAERRLQE